jgi:hypothetical protein
MAQNERAEVGMRKAATRTYLDSENRPQLCTRRRTFALHAPSRWGAHDDEPRMRSRHHALTGLLCLAACGRPAPAPPIGPPPLADDLHPRVRATLDAQFAARYPLAGPSVYRFAEPVRGRVAAWHWEPQQEGHVHQLGYLHGWCVEFQVTPNYADYPPQPESRRMAFWAEGKLRGVFAAGGGNAPLELDKWSPDWVDPAWPPRASAPGR